MTQNVSCVLCSPESVSEFSQHVDVNCRCGDDKFGLSVGARIQFRSYAAAGFVVTVHGDGSRTEFESQCMTTTENLQELLRLHGIDIAFVRLEFAKARWMEKYDIAYYPPLLIGHKLWRPALSEMLFNILSAISCPSRHAIVRLQHFAKLLWYSLWIWQQISWNYDHTCDRTFCVTVLTIITFKVGEVILGRISRAKCKLDVFAYDCVYETTIFIP